MSSASTIDERAARQGKLLVHHLHILIKTAQIHEPTNVAVDRPLADVMGMFKGAGGTEEAHLRLRGDHLYCGETRLKMDIEGFHSLLWLIEEMQKREIGSILFKEAARPEEIKRFAYMFVQFDPKVSDPYEAFSEEMRKGGITGIEIEKFREEKAAVIEAPQDLKQMAKDTYARAVGAATEVINNAKLGKAVGFRKAKRMVQSLVDLLLQEEHTLLGLTTLRCHDEYTHNHSVNVCILSLTLATRLGYSKKHLGDMGVAFLFHDVGKVDIPLEVLNKPSSFSDDEWRVMRTHPVQGVKTLIKLKGLGDPLISMMVTAAFEHHLGYDGTGYPKLLTPWQQSLIGRIATISDCYDAMTASRVYHRVPHAPEKALQFMLEQSGKAFDPTLLKIFVNAIGIYPVGTLVLLDSNELAVVVQANPTPRKMARPRVKIITNSAGDEIDGEVVDLAEREERSGHYRRSILKTVDTTKHGIDVSKYFL
jgi:HD-GYP domain-containing protein (c-di-GMP phosphodiesterase class II)